MLASVYLFESCSKWGKEMGLAAGHDSPAWRKARHALSCTSSCSHQSRGFNQPATMPAPGSDQSAAFNDPTRTAAEASCCSRGRQRLVQGSSSWGWPPAHPPLPPCRRYRHATATPRARRLLLLTSVTMLSCAYLYLVRPAGVLAHDLQTGGLQSSHPEARRQAEEVGGQALAGRLWPLLLPGMAHARSL